MVDRIKAPAARDILLHNMPRLTDGEALMKQSEKREQQPWHCRYGRVARAGAEMPGGLPYGGGSVGSPDGRRPGSGRRLSHKEVSIEVESSALFHGG